MQSVLDSELGKPTVYAEHYDASRLFPIARAPTRKSLGLRGKLPFFGGDIWNAYELSWLDLRGRPRQALVRLEVPAVSPNIIESKSLKLYLNGFMQERLSDDELLLRLRRDLSQAAGDAVEVTLASAAQWSEGETTSLAGTLIDAVDTDITHYGPPDRELLIAHRDLIVEETLLSHALKSNCPVTGQPDWASVQVSYRGPRIGRAGLLRYLCSYRQHADFHEHCVERIYLDIQRCCAPSRLRVLARYTRRGGIDINPWRCSEAGGAPANGRTPRQ